MKRVKIWFRIGVYGFLGVIILSFAWSWYVSYRVAPYIYHEEERVPASHVGVLLGTAKYAHSGSINLYYKYRLQSALRLHALGKFNYLIVSGDNSTKAYNEPTVMKNDLIRQGIAAEKIFEDFAGFRTLDSMVRSKHVFGQDSILVISQKFHAERAVFIAHKRGIAATGFCARDVDVRYGAKTRIREHFARIKLFVDLYILNKQPKFLGEAIQIPS